MAGSATSAVANRIHTKLEKDITEHRTTHLTAIDDDDDQDGDDEGNDDNDDDDDGNTDDDDGDDDDDNKATTTTTTTTMTTKPSATMQEIAVPASTTIRRTERWRQ